MTEEIWLPIKGFENEYRISNHGRVITISRPIYRKDGSIHYTQKERIRKLYANPQTGYLVITVRKYPTLLLIHRIVAEHFIPNPDNKSQVNHIDGNRQNNHVSNLEWNTPSENNLHSIRTLKRRGSMYVAYDDFGNVKHAFNNPSEFEREGFIQQSVSCATRLGTKYKGMLWKRIPNSPTS